MRSVICSIQRVAFLCPAIICILITLLLCVSTSRGYAATIKHGCAPFAPPPVPGTLTIPPATPGIVLINEALSNPGTTWNCAEQGTFSVTSDSWIELFNPQNEALNLYAARAYFDTGPNSNRYYFPFGAAIAPHGYLALFPNSENSILLAGNNVRLVFLATVIDQVSIPALAVDESYARIPDGSSSWQITTNPTIAASNLASNATPTPTAQPPTSTQTSGSGPGGTGNTGYTPATVTPIVVSGTQPAWNTLNLPPVAQGNPTPIATIPTSALPLSSANASPPASDVPRRVILTALLLALAASLFWCWKVFSSH